MKEKKQTMGNLAKVGRLVQVLQICNGKGVVGGEEAPISPKAAKIVVRILLVLLVCGGAVGMYMLQPLLSPFLSVEILTELVMLILLLMSFVLAIKDAVTVLYAADDLEALLPMPFSATQIVMAKVAVTAAFPIGVSMVVLNAVCLGFGIRAGMGASYIIGTLLSSVMIPVTGIAVATLLVVIIFRIFGVLRNRNLIVALGGIFSLGLSFAYIIITNVLQRDGASDAAAALGMVGSVSNVLPSIAFMIKFMMEGSISGLLISLVLTIALMLLTALAVKAFYLSTALSMQNTVSGKQRMSEELLHSGKKRGTLKCLTAYESKNTRRNPAYLVYGFVMSMIWPALFAIPLLFGDQLSGLTFPLGNAATVLTVLTFTVTASCYACGFNILANTAFSREGSGFAVIRSLPVPLTDYYKSKRNFAMMICSIGSVLYVIVLGVICIITGVISIGNAWTIPVGALLCLFLNLIWINLMLVRNSRAPSLQWESEAEISRKLGLVNVIALILGIVTYVGFIFFINMSLEMQTDPIVKAAVSVFVGALIVVFVISIIINLFAVKAGARNLTKVE